MMQRQNFFGDTGLSKMQPRCRCAPKAVTNLVETFVLFIYLNSYQSPTNDTFSLRTKQVPAPVNSIILLEQISTRNQSTIFFFYIKSKLTTNHTTIFFSFNKSEPGIEQPNKTMIGDNKR
jgi:hypothetical protein